MMTTLFSWMIICESFCLVLQKEKKDFQNLKEILLKLEMELESFLGQVLFLHWLILSTCTLISIKNVLLDSKPESFWCWLLPYKPRFISTSPENRKNIRNGFFHSVTSTSDRDIRNSFHWSMFILKQLHIRMNFLPQYPCFSDFSWWKFYSVVCW